MAFSPEQAQGILANLQAVEHERTLRAAEPELGRRARAVRIWQAERLRSTHADLLQAEDTRAAAGFFLEQLYGAEDFVERDAQFARIVPAIVRLFSAEVCGTVARLAELHALSERLDTDMARALENERLDADLYRVAWRAVGQPQAREQQTRLAHDIGLSLVRYTRHPKLGMALRLMRMPARASGLQALQRFLETGFETFGRLPDPQGFVLTICQREREHVAALFAA
jgi:hypothetical protein